MILIGSTISPELREELKDYFQEYEEEEEDQFDVVENPENPIKREIPLNLLEDMKDMLMDHCREQFVINITEIAQLILRLGMIEKENPVMTKLNEIGDIINLYLNLYFQKAIYQMAEVGGLIIPEDPEKLIKSLTEKFNEIRKLMREDLEKTLQSE